MTGRTHDAIAFASLVTVAAYFPPGDLNMTTIFAAVVANVVGALVPDMDQATNRLWDLLPGGDWLGKVFKNIFLGHRSITHSLLGAFLFYHISFWLFHRIFNPIYVNADVVFWASFVGYVSHLLADSMTKDGLPLFFPLEIKVGVPPVSFLRITTGSWMERFVVLPAVGVYIFWFIGRSQSQLLYVVRLLSG